MRKILVLINNDQFPHSVMDFVLHLSKKEQCKINGLFARNPNAFEIKTVVNEKKPGQEDEIRIFKDRFAMEKLDYYVQTITENYLDTIIDETAFADVLICNADMNHQQFSMKNFISSAHCPVILVPAGASFFNEIIFTYDGHISSIHSLKQFTYLFPFCHVCKVFLISVLPVNIMMMEYDVLVREWILLHYPNAEIIILRGDIKSEMSDFINAKKNSLVVMGAFGRSALSRLFKESLAPAILETTQAPIFIAHA